MVKLILGIVLGLVLSVVYKQGLGESEVIAADEKKHGFLCWSVSDNWTRCESDDTICHRRMEHISCYKR